MSQDTSHYFSCNFGVYNSIVGGIGGTRYQDTSHFSSHHCGEMVDVEGRGQYRSHTSHSSLLFSGVRCRLSGLSFPYLPVYENFH